MQFIMGIGLIADIIVIISVAFLPGNLIHGQSVIKPVVENSTPSVLNVAKGSSVWLHWNYAYVGDGPHNTDTILWTEYDEQLIGFSSPSNSEFQVLARRIGQNGALTLEPSIPAPFNRRVEVIPSNSTLVIHQLQYNDSVYQFESRITINFTIDHIILQKVYILEPVVLLSLQVQLNMPLNMKAKLLHKSRGIELEWNKVESGAYLVKYDVTFKNASGYDLHSKTGYNIGGMSIYNITDYSYITDVQLIVSFKSTFTNTTVKVSETLVTASPPTTGSNNGGAIVPTTSPYSRRTIPSLNHCSEVGTVPGVHIVVLIGFNVLLLKWMS